MSCGWPCTTPLVLWEGQDSQGDLAFASPLFCSTLEETFRLPSFSRVLFPGFLTFTHSIPFYIPHIFACLHFFPFSGACSTLPSWNWVGTGTLDADSLGPGGNAYFVCQ